MDRLLSSFYRHGRTFLEVVNKQFDKILANYSHQHINAIDQLIHTVQTTTTTLTRIRNTAKQNKTQSILTTASVVKRVQESFVTRMEIFYTRNKTKVQRGALKYKGIDGAEIVQEQYPSSSSEDEQQDDSSSDDSDTTDSEEDEAPVAAVRRPAVSTDSESDDGVGEDQMDEDYV